MKQALMAWLFLWGVLFSLNAYAHQIADDAAQKLPTPDEYPNSRYLEGHALLLAWQLDQASKLVKEAEAEADSDPDAAYFLAHYYFTAGEYQKAEEFLAKAVPKPNLNIDFFEKRLKAALRIVGNFKRVRRGNFEFRFKKGIDEILVDYAAETLQKAYKRIGEDLGYKPKHTVVVEFITSQEELGSLVGLDPKAIDTTGTIAICKFNRIIITTPRVTVMGYRWLDTLTHEYTHLVVSEVSANTVPIWLHEGIAKFEETRWRANPGGFLDAYSETLLARALRTGKLVSLEEMHPSMALLPSKEAGATAFAEVLTIVQFLYKKHGGYANLRKLLALLRSGNSMDSALRKTYGFDLKGLEIAWRRYLRTLHLREKTNQSALEVSYKNDSQATPKSEEKITEAEEDLFLGKGKGARYFKLGKLLKDRGRHRAAVVEFEKAQRYIGTKNPLLQNALAASLIEIGKPEKARTELEPLLKLYDGPAMTYYNLGKACMALNDYDCAKKYFEETIAINPFDPRSHAFLAEIYSRIGNTELAKREATVFERLRVYLTAN